MNPGENVNQGTNHNEWADAMADVKPFDQNVQSEQSQQTKSEQEKSEEELTTSIKRGYFEKSPDALKGQTREFLETSTYSKDFEGGFLDQALEAYSSEIEAAGVSVSDLLSLSSVCYNERHYRNGDSYRIPTQSPKRAEFCLEGLKDAHDRYFSESAPADQRQLMSSILKKMRFLKDLTEEIHFDEERGKRSLLSYGEAKINGEYFEDRDLYRHPEKAGLPPELKDYHFELTNEELKLLANAEGGDILADELRFVMPAPVQEKILELMPDEKYNDIARATFESEEKKAMQKIDTVWGEQDIREAEETRKKMSVARSIAQNITDRNEMEGLLSMSGVKLQSHPDRPNNDWAQIFNAVTGMGRHEIFTREQREQEDKDLEKRRQELKERHLNAARKEQVVREGNF